MSRVSALLSRIAAACALLLVAALLAPGGSASAAPTAGELSYACALKSNGLLRAVSSLSECKSNETTVTLKPGPTTVCTQPSGSTRVVTKPKDCKPPATSLTLPPLSGTVYFCAALPSGTLRYVTGPGQCLSGEVQVQVTPNDAAPRVTSTSPADGATHIATDVSPTITFSEPVSGTANSFAFTCDGVSVSLSLSGVPGSTLTLDPTEPLPQGASCTISAYASAISDVDTLDPPDNPEADTIFSFTTDAAPSLVSSSPVGDATGVATSTNVVLSFSEPVDVASGAFTLACGGPDLPYAVTGSHTATVTVNPDADLPQTATCTLSAPAASITDVDAGDPPDALTVPVGVTFTTVDAAPSVTSTTPGDGAAHIATNADVSVTFSEPVTLAAGAFTLVCDSGTIATTTGTADQTTYTFSPSSALTAGDNCTGTVDKTKVTDNDAVDPPDNPAANYGFSFT
ncbi:MAG TPA: Ig-like domain-containing protein, partial [Humibacillus sp.]|nr:Ig-like domain-containing protein [Humibacillus sp.]